MERRSFLRTGLAFGAVGMSGGLSLLPEIAHASPRVSSDSTLRLNSNENPFGVAPAARSAIIDNLGEANRYPRTIRTDMVEALATLHGVKPANIVLGNGSTEVLQMSVQALAKPGAKLVLADPTFEDVPRYANPYTYDLQKVPLDSNYAHDIGRMKEIVDASSGRALVYICNPNNPTGTLTPSADIDAWIKSGADDVYFLVDEAYYEYCTDAGYWSCVKFIDDPNVIVSRSFSKIYGMAGMRLGYAVTHEKTADMLRAYIASSNANYLALAAGHASLKDTELIARSRKANTEGTRILHEALDEADLEYLPSYTNFVMHRIRGDQNIYRGRMAEAGARVGRNFPPMLNYNRLSIGTPEEMERFVSILRDFHKKGWV
jgi:histidinol-phosphate aminotransferase